MSLPMPAEARAEIRTVVKTMRQEWREQVTAMTKAAPRGKLGARVGLMRCELDMFDDWVAETGGEERAAFFVCALVMSRSTLEDIARDYALHPGLLGAFMRETPEREAQYFRAQRGLADAYVAEIVPLVDSVEPGEGGGRGGGGGSSSPDVPWRRLQAEMRLKVAGKWDRARFGEDKQIGVTSAPTINFVMGEGSVLSVSAPVNAVLTGETYEHDESGRVVGQGAVERGEDADGGAAGGEGGNGREGPDAGGWPAEPPGAR